jgi:hypothetical protein
LVLEISVIPVILPQSSVTTPKFKFEGNARQYEFNSSLIDEVSKARVLLEQKSIAAAKKI